ncbi:MAG: DUF927 domain-containing protein [Firmicutes bacterium]|nr:DUF927 domain-containing protein [Bacillota bacterium]
MIKHTRHWPALMEALEKWARFIVRQGAMPRRRRIGQPGWAADERGTAVFALPDEVLGAAPRDRDWVAFDPHRAPAARVYTARGGFEEEQDAIAALLVHFPRTAWLLGHAAAAPLVRWLCEAGCLDVSGYVVEVVSDRTGVGKSFAVGAALAPWGAPTLRFLDATDYGLQEYLRQHSDLPSAFQEAQANPRLRPESLVHTLADAGGRLQGRRNGGLRPLSAIYGVLLMANNQTIVSDGAQQGAQVRVLTTESLLPMLDDPAPIHDLTRAFREHHGHGGRRAIQWLLAETAGAPDRIEAKVVALWESAMEDLERSLTAALPAADSEARGQLQRVGKLLAAGLAGLDLLRHGYGWADGLWAIARDGYLGVIRDLAVEWQIQRQPTWRAALEALAGLIAQQAHRVAGMERRVNGSPTPPADGYIGAWVSVRGEPSPCLGLNPQWAIPELLRAMRYADIATLERAWERQGVLVPGNGRRRRLFRLPMADGRSILCPGWVFRPRTADGWEWAPRSLSEHGSGDGDV